MPGLLHLAFTRSDGRRRHYVMTDAPGLWFQKWAIHRDTPEAEGARWVAEHADAFLLIADCEALSGTAMGKARGSIQMLARRLGAERRGRPVALVWSKADVSVSRAMEEEIRNFVLEQLPCALEFRVSVAPECDEAKDTGQGLLELLRWSLDVRRNTLLLPEPRGDNPDPFFLVGRR